MRWDGPGSRRGLRTLSIVVPLCLIAALYFVSTRLLSSWSANAESVFVIGSGVAGVVGFSTAIFRVIDRQDQYLARQYSELEERYATERRLRAQLEALHQASLAIASARNDREILQRLVDLARDLIGTKYAALGVAGVQGGIEAFYTSGVDDDTRARVGNLPTGRGLLGISLAEGISMRVANIGEDPRRVGFPAGHPIMQSLLIVPVAQVGNVVGNLYLADKSGGITFTDEDEVLLNMLAGHAAVVIERARLAEQIRMLAVAAERERIRRDMHDSVMQAVYSVNLELEMAEDDLETDPEETRAGITLAMDRLQGVLRDLRSYVLGLKTEDEADTLPEALATMLAQTRAHSLLETEIEVSGPGIAAIPPTVSQGLLFIAREAVANVVRHGRAGYIWITLQGGAGFVELRIVDNGAGFDAMAPQASEQQGLRNMRDRTLSLGGRFAIQSEKGGGTTVHVHVPVPGTGQEKLDV